MKRPKGLNLAETLVWFGVPTEPVEGCIRPRPESQAWERPDGYYDVGFGGETRTLHSLIVEHDLGFRPRKGVECRHICGNAWCINPADIRLGTYLENQDDQYSHGTRVMGERHPQAKLTDAQVVEMRALFGSQSDKEIAALYGVTRQTVNDIRLGRRRAHAPEMSPDQYRALARAS